PTTAASPSPVRVMVSPVHGWSTASSSETATNSVAAKTSSTTTEVTTRRCRSSASVITSWAGAGAPAAASAMSADCSRATLLPMSPPPRRSAAVRRRRAGSRPGGVRGALRITGRVVSAALGIAVTALGCLYLTLPDVRPLVDQPPVETAFMRLRADEAHARGVPARRAYTWVPYGRISTPLRGAVPIAEDDLFWQHDGVDLASIRQAIEDRLEGGDRVLGGGSTMTQQ